MRNDRVLADRDLYGRKGLPGRYMTRVFFVRHAEPDQTVKDDRNRPLSERGTASTSFVTDILRDKGIDIAFSSPYKRSLDTIKPFTDHAGIQITTDERFRERGGGKPGQGLRNNPERWKAGEWKEDWGESIAEVQKRNVEALMDVLDRFEGHNIVIGTHGTAFSTILAYLSSEYGYDDFIRMMDWMPNIVEIVFNGKKAAAINELGHLGKITFPESEYDAVQKRLDKQGFCYTTRVYKEVGKYKAGEAYLAPWGEVLIIDEVQTFSKVSDRPFFDEMSEEEKNEIRKYSEDMGLPYEFIRFSRPENHKEQAGV